MLDAIIFLSAAMPEGRVFGLDSQTLIQVGIHLLSGIILAVALSFLLYKPVKEYLDKRRERIRNDIDSANATRAKANAQIADYEARLAAIEQERIEILESARQQAKKEAQLILEESMAAAEQIKNRARDSAAQDKKRLHEEVRLNVIELSSLIAREHVASSMDKDARNLSFDRALAQLEEAQWQR